MQETAAYREKLNIYVKHTLASGVKPIELYMQPVYECYGGQTVAYRAAARVNSMIFGTMEADDYCYSAADESVLAAFSFRVIKKSLSFLRRLQSAENSLLRPPVKALFVRCPSCLLDASELYVNLKLLLAESGVSEKDNKLCLEFDGAATDAESAALTDAFSDIRAASFKTAIGGYGGAAFSLEKLLSVCPDYVFTDGKLSQLALDRGRRSAIAPLINYAKSLGAETVACGVSSDEELREFRSRDCFGFVPSAEYRGVLAVREKQRSAAETLLNHAEGDGNV